MQNRYLFFFVAFIACGDDAMPMHEVDMGADRGSDMTSRDTGLTDATLADADVTPADATLGDAAVADTAEDTTPDMQSPVPGVVEAIVLTGHMGRRMLTCDRGTTFVYDHSADDGVRCWNMSGGSGPDCDHHPLSNNSVAFGAGRFVATAGWGSVSDTEGGLFVSDGSSDWRQVSPGTTYNGVIYGNGTFMANSGDPLVSHDGGATWETAGRLDYATSRGAYFADVMGGRHILYRDTLADSWISSDAGASFWHPRDASSCGRGAQVILGGDILVGYSRTTDRVCVSRDGGEVWSGGELPDDLSSEVVWNGSTFLAWGNGARFRSVDGLSWEREERSGAPNFPDRIRRLRDGTLVAVVSAWGGYYERSGFFTSNDDGRTWIRSPASDMLNGHPIRGMAVGEVPASICE